jgi:hypothetical protein
MEVHEVKIGDLAYVQYLDISLFRHKTDPSNSGLAEPFVMDVVGWAVDMGDYYNIIFEWAYGKWDNGAKEQRPHGSFAIPKSLILKIRKLDSTSFIKQVGVTRTQGGKNDV